MLPILALAVSLSQTKPPSDLLQVDPLLVVQASEIWSIIGRKDNPVWSGWDARNTPVLIYCPGRQDLLINHPNPPEGFRPYPGPLRTPIGKMMVRDGKTLFESDGQNTTRAINGIETLVVADTLSTRRQWVKGLADSVAANPGQADEIITGGLFPNPYSSMTMFVHEAFHAYQRKMAPTKSPNEDSLVRYPSLSVPNNVGFALEAQCLAAALRAKTPAEARAEGVRWLAARQMRRSAISPEAAKYEDASEFSEGLAKYVEYRILQNLDGRKPSSEMWLVQGFRGYGDMATERDRMIRQMDGYLSGRNVVNNDLYGASSVRFRLYFSGMAVSALLDRLGMKWHHRILRSDATLTSLAQEAIAATPAELSSARQGLEGRPIFGELTASKTKLAQDGDAHIAAELAKFTSGPGELVLDYSGLTAPKVQFTYTSFGILRIDDDRNIYRLIPIGGIIDGLGFSESYARPVLHDRKAKRVHLQLTGAPTVAENGEIDAKTLDLPGVALKNVKGRIQREGNRVTIHLRS